MCKPLINFCVFSQQRACLKAFKVCDFIKGFFTSLHIIYEVMELQLRAPDRNLSKIWQAELP